MKKLLPVRPSHRPAPTSSRLDAHIDAAKREKELQATTSETSGASSASESESASMGLHSNDRALVRRVSQSKVLPTPTASNNKSEASDATVTVTTPSTESNAKGDNGENERTAAALLFKKRSISQSKLATGTATTANEHNKPLPSYLLSNPKDAYRASSSNEKRERSNAKSDHHVKTDTPTTTAKEKEKEKDSEAPQPKFSLQGDLFILDKKERDWKKVYCTVDQNMMFSMWTNNKREHVIDKVDLKTLTSPYHVFDNNEYNDLIWNEQKFGFQILTTVCGS
jgi:hypothetical protein